MGLLSIELEWLRPRRVANRPAFKLVPQREENLPDIPLPSLFARTGAKEIIPPSIEWAGTVPLEPYEPLARFHDLPGAVAKITKAEEALDFYNKFGSLYRKDPSKPGFRDSVPEILKFAEEVRVFLHQHRGSPRWALKVGPIPCHIVADPKSEEFGLAFHAPSLEEAIAVQMCIGLTGGRTFEFCRHCGKRFETGPKSKPRRRRHAKFCSIPCQNRHKSTSKGKRHG